MKLRPDEILSVGIKRVAREQLDGAVAHARGERGASVAVRVHETRKSLKKVRATLRLVRKPIGKKAYRRENGRLRDAGRLLAPVREAAVAVETIDLIAGRGGLTEADLRPVRRVLERREREAEQALADDGTLERVAVMAAEGRATVDAWAIDRVDSRAFEASLRRTYARGADAFVKAYADPSPERFHDLRKRVKDLWYHARTLCPAAPRELEALRDLADEAGDLLGLDHDLAALWSAVSGRGGAVAKADIDDAAERARLRDRVERAVEQERLRGEADVLPLLRRIYSESPKAFSKRIAAAFDAWRAELASDGVRWLTPEAAGEIRALLERKAGAQAAEQDRIRAELRAWGMELSELAAEVPGAGAGFGAEHFDELVERGAIRIASAADLDGESDPDRLRRVALDVGANEASAICPIGSEAALAARGWDVGFWIVLDDTTVDQGIVAVGRGGSQWQAERPAVEAPGAPPTDDSEDCVRVGEWVYVFGSHYGAKEGPIERERQFVARFRDDDLAAGSLDLRVAPTRFRLHRLINDALADSGIELFPLSDHARSELIGDALGGPSDAEAEPGDDIRPSDLPINVEGCAWRAATGGVLIGLRFPTSADGHPLLVEVDDLHELFDPGPGLPAVKGVWEVEAVGNRHVPAGIRGLSEGADGRIEAIVGSLDSVDEDSILIAEHPEAALALSAHFGLRLPGNRRHGGAEAELVREFPGRRRVEGVVADLGARTFLYVVDDERHVELLHP